MKKLLLVYNPHSGKGEFNRSLSKVLCVFTNAGYDCTVHPTAKSGDGYNYIVNNGGEFDMIVFSGGDGMLHELVCGMTASGNTKPCGYIPSGTVNDFASSLGISKVPVEAAKTIVGGSCENIDVGCFNDSYFAYIAAFGIFTNVSYTTSQRSKKALGATAYLFEALKGINLKNLYDSSVHAVVSWDGHSVEDDFIFGMTGNTHSVAGLKNIVPVGAEMNDGLLDGMFIRTPKTIPELEQIQFALLKQKHDIPNILCVRSNRFEVRAGADVPWTLDGEFGGELAKAEISAKHRSIKIVVPNRG